MKATYKKFLCSDKSTIAVYKITEKQTVRISYKGEVDYYTYNVSLESDVKSTAKKFNEFKAMAIQKLQKA